MMQFSQPDISRETRLSRLHGGLVAGVDEAGRGPWAGPVVAAAVILDPARIPDGIDDSKKLTKSERERLAGELMRGAMFGAGFVSVRVIDEINILQASLEAMRLAVAALREAPAAALIDGRDRPRLDCPCEPVIGGDALSLSIAAASIIAKVMRDKLMAELAADHPGYGWATNAGYGTREHHEGLRRLGITPHHRRSFAPIRALLGEAA